MKKNEITEKLEMICCDVLNIQKDFSLKLSPNSVPGWDSFVNLVLITSIEKEFDISFRLEEVVALTDIESILNLIISYKD